MDEERVKVKEWMESDLKEKIDGNGKPGLKDDIADIKSDIRVLSGTITMMASDVSKIKENHLPNIYASLLKIEKDDARDEGAKEGSSNFWMKLGVFASIALVLADVLLHYLPSTH